LLLDETVVMREWMFRGKLLAALASARACVQAQGGELLSNLEPCLRGNKYRSITTVIQPGENQKWGWWKCESRW